MAIVGVIGDTHLPYELEGYLEFCYETFEAWGVDTVVHIGDFVDNHSLSFHDSEPLLHDVHGEYQSAIERAREWYDTFPSLTLIMGNHDRIPARKLKTLGMEPNIYMKPLEEIMEMPDGWHIAELTASETTRRIGCSVPCLVTITATSGSVTVRLIGNWYGAWLWAAV